MPTGGVALVTLRWRRAGDGDECNVVTRGGVAEAAAVTEAAATLLVVMR